VRKAKIIVSASAWKGISTYVRSVVIVRGDDCVSRGEAQVPVQVIGVAVGVGAGSGSGRDGANKGDGNGRKGDGELHCRLRDEVRAIWKVVVGCGR
jgi:hypothetical protein